MAYTVAMGIQDIEQAKSFFEEYNIPYQEIKSGDKKGKLKVKALRDRDLRTVTDINDAVRRYHPELWDHENAFYDAEDHLVVTFSPYTDLTVAEKREDGSIYYKPKDLKMPGYRIEVSLYSIYGMGTQTVVVREK